MATNLNYNKVVLGGRLTATPEMKKNKNSDKMFCTFSIAVNRQYEGKDGTRVDFFDCIAGGKTGEVINQYFVKGDPIFIEGELRSDSWTTESGAKRSSYVIVVSEFRFVEGKKGEA